MATTIRDIARRLNISVSTVSYALNDGPRPVPEEVRRKVLETAREMNYRTNRLARAMITGRTYTIGLVPSGLAHNLFLSPYLQQALAGIANAATDLHHDLVVFTRFDAKDTDKMLGFLLDGRIDGALFVAPQLTASAAEQIRASQLPAVIVAGQAGFGIPAFRVDNRMGIFQLMGHLFELGHRDFAFVGGVAGMEDADTRRNAFEAFMADRGLSLRPEWVRSGDFTVEGGRAALSDLLALPHRPTAIVCANDEMALGVIGAAREAGIEVPRELSVTGFDLSPYGAVINPAVTTVRQPTIEIAEAATAALVRMIEGAEAIADQIFPTELIVRDSTARPLEDAIP